MSNKFGLLVGLSTSSTSCYRRAQPRWPRGGGWEAGCRGRDDTEKIMMVMPSILFLSKYELYVRKRIRTSWKTGELSLFASYCTFQISLPRDLHSRGEDGPAHLGVPAFQQCHKSFQMKFLSYSSVVPFYHTLQSPLILLQHFSSP